MADQSTAPETNINDERAVRRAKRQALIDAGINPYPIKSEITAHAAELAEKYADLEDGGVTEDEYSLAGRIRAYRKQGKIRFIVLEDVSGEIQLFCRANTLGEGAWELLGQLDLGDIIKVKVLEVDPKTGKISLDRLDKPEAPAGSAPARRERDDDKSSRKPRERKPRRSHEA